MRYLTDPCSLLLRKSYNTLQLVCEEPVELPHSLLRVDGSLEREMDDNIVVTRLN